MRRRQRRLRSWLRHERMTVAMALAEVTHHTAPRGHMIARVREEERDELYDAKGLMTPLPSRPTPLVEVRPQGRVQRHFLEHMADFCPYVQILDAPVPQTVEQLPDVLRFFDTLILLPSSLSMCPRSSSSASRREPRFMSRSWRNSWWKCRRLFPILPCSGPWSSTLTFQFPRRGGGISGLRGVFPGQSSTAQLASQDRTSGRIAEQIVGFPVCRGGFQIFAQDWFHPLLRTFQLTIKKAWMSLVKGFSHLSPWEKSAEVAGQVSARVPPHSSSWTPAAYETPSGSEEWVELYDDVKSKAYYWNRRTNSTAWVAPAGVEVVWVGKQEEGGGIWYWHKRTRVSTYALPPLPPE